MLPLVSEQSSAEMGSLLNPQVLNNSCKGSKSYAGVAIYTMVSNTIMMRLVPEHERFCNIVTYNGNPLSCSMCVRKLIPCGINCYSHFHPKKVT